MTDKLKALALAVRDHRVGNMGDISAQTLAGMQKLLEFRGAASPDAILALIKRAEDAESALKEANDDLQFVERWANHHGQKPHMTPQETLSCIQHYPAIKAITKSYSDGKVPETRNPYAEIEALQARVNAMESQEPVGTIHEDGYWVRANNSKGKAVSDAMSRGTMNRLEVFALPVLAPGAAPKTDQWTDADSDAARLALELECLLTDTKDLSVVSKWWVSAMEALDLHRARLSAKPNPMEKMDNLERLLVARAAQAAPKGEQA